MVNRREALLALGALALSSSSSSRDSPAIPDNEFRKFEKYNNFVRKRHADDYAITTPNGINQAKYLNIGGIQQWVTVRGEDLDNPVVLLLHGGPGDCTNPWGYAGFRTWLKDYTIVQWDQRGAGRTLGRNGLAIANTVTIDRMVQDGVELADAVRTWLRKNQIVLLGHSWGSVLGALIARKAPQFFQAYVGTGQVGHTAGAYDVAFTALLAEARVRGEGRAIRELQEIGPPPYKDGRGYQVQRRWSNFFEGADAFIASMVGFALTAPGYTIRDVNDWSDGMVLSAEKLISQENALSPALLGGRFKLPVFVIQGEADFTTPASLAKAFVDHLEAPRKAFVTIKGGHFAVFMHSPEFLRQLSALLVPGSAKPQPG